MRVLLDTHALYWYFSGDSQLSVTASSIVQDTANQILVSPASFWEIAIKVSLGKWRLLRSYDDFVDLTLKTYGFQLLPILPSHTASLITLPFHHKDPFDRLLIAQALVEQISIVSNDAAFDAYSITRLW